MAVDNDIRNVNGEWQSYSGGTWYPSTRGLVQVLDAIGVHNVTGSGNAMRFHYTAGESSGVLNMQQMQSAVERHNEPLTAPAEPGSFEELWNENMGDIPYPDFRVPNPNTDEPMDGTVDSSKILDAVRAYEAVNGPLPGGGAGEIIPLGKGYDQDVIIGADGKVTKIDKAKAGVKAYEPGVAEGIDLPGYDVLQQPTGQLTPVQQRQEATYTVDPKTMTGYFQQPDGSLQQVDTPSTDDIINQHLIDGNMDAAVGFANFRDRPTSLEYFNAAMEWSRTPADIFTISAIVRGIFEPVPGPMGELRRVGAPPAWASEAWQGLQASMGVPSDQLTATPNADPGTGNSVVANNAVGSLNIPSTASPESASTTFDGVNVNPSPTDFEAAGDYSVAPTRAAGTDIFGNVIGGDQFPAAMGDVEPASVSAFQKLLDSGLEGTDIFPGRVDTGDRSISMNDGTTPDDIETFFTNLSDEQKAFINQWEGGIWTFAQSAQNMAELQNNLNFHFGNSEEIFGTAISQIDGDPLGVESFIQEGTAGDDEYIGGWNLADTLARLERERLNEQATMADPLGFETFDTLGGEVQSSFADQADFETFDTQLGGRADTQPTNYNQMWDDSPLSPAFDYNQMWDDNFLVDDSVSTGWLDPFGFETIVPAETSRVYPSVDIDPGYPVGNINQAVPRPGAQPSTTQPWELTKGRVEQAYDPTGYTYEPDVASSGIYPGDPLFVEDFISADRSAAEMDVLGATLPEPERIDFEDFDPYYGAEGGFQRIVPEIAEKMYSPYEYEESAPITPIYDEPVQYYDEFAFGGFSQGGPALVGEMGPELVDLPPGAQVMPAGITEMMRGRPTRAPRSLFRQAGMRAPSAQTISNLLPEEIEVYQEMGRLAGIPEKAFEREFRSMVPMGQGGTRQARFTPRGTGRTRYGST